MSKGLKIDKAKLVSTGLDVYLNNFNEANRGNLECETCSARLKYTKSHWRNNNRTWVSSFFSLSPNVVHSANCNYNILRAIEILVSKSISIENGELPTLFKHEVNWEFRLHILAEAVSNTTITRKEKESNPNSIIRRVSANQLPPYLNTAKGIAKLWNTIQEREDKEILEEKIHLVLKQKKIAWKDFVFETDDLSRLVTNRPGFPVALILQTKKLGDSKDSRLLKNCIQCFSPRRVKKSIVPRIYFNDLNLKESCQYLIVANVKVAAIKDKSDFINLNIFVHNKGQVTILNEEEVNSPNNYLTLNNNTNARRQCPQ